MDDEPPPPYHEVAAKGYEPPLTGGAYPPPNQPVMIQPPPPQVYPTVSGYQPVPTSLPNPYYPPGPQTYQKQYVAGRAEEIYMGPPAVVVGARAPESFVVHIVLSCFVFLCCGILFGLIAFLLAIFAQCVASSSPKSARQLGRASVGVSVTGMLLAMIVTVMMISLTPHHQYNHNGRKTSNSLFCKYKVNGRCFSTRSMSTFCPDGYYSERYCYTDESPATLLPNDEDCKNVPIDQRIDCGFGGITRQQCHARQCCFDSSVDGVVWCFKKPASQQYPKPTTTTTKAVTPYPKTTTTREGTNVSSN